MRVSNPSILTTAFQKRDQMQKPLICIKAYLSAKYYKKEVMDQPLLTNSRQEPLIEHDFGV